jgi:hypothetical protein
MKGNLLRITVSLQIRRSRALRTFNVMRIKFLISKDEVVRLFENIPFLNGGLFDCLDKEDEQGKVIFVDGFSRNPAKSSTIPR